jgi:MFS family permease
VLLCGSFANAFGNGVVFPFFLIYLHNVRDIPLGTAGLVLAVSGIASLVGGPIAGAMVDRIGAKGMLVFAMLASIVGFGGLIFVRDAPQAFALAIVIGLANGAFWPSHASLVAALTERESRHNAYAMQRVLNNLGIGLGGLVGGVIATTSDPRTYELLFVIDAVTFVIYLGLLGFVSSPPRHPREHDGARHGYRRVLADHTFLGVVLLNAAVMGIGFALLGDLFPAYAKNEAGVSETAIGLIFLANTLVIVIAQLPVARMLEGRRRMVAYAVEGVIWAFSWLTVAVAGVWFFGTDAAVLFGVAFGVFAIGECFHGTVKNALTADLARPGLLGRYMALDAAGIVVGNAVGRAGGGFMLASAPNLLWVVAAFVALAGGAYALVLERFLPADIRRTPYTVPPPSQTVAEVL